MSNKIRKRWGSWLVTFLDWEVACCNRNLPRMAFLTSWIKALVSDIVTLSKVDSAGAPVPVLRLPYHLRVKRYTLTPGLLKWDHYNLTYRYV